MANEIKRRLVRDVAARGPRRLTKQEIKLAEAIRTDENLELMFDQPMVVGAVTPAGAAAVLSGNLSAGNKHILGHGKDSVESYVSAVNGTVGFQLPYVSASGLELPLDANATDGVTAREICAGILSTNKYAKVVGTDEDFMMEAKILIDDISGLGEMFVGFRTAEAYQADPDDYNNMAAFHIGENGATLADGSMNIATIDDNASTSYTTGVATAWADTNEKTLRVIVRQDRSVEFYVDGVRITGVTHSMDSADVVVPFIHVSKASASTTTDPGVSITHLKCGFV